MGRHLLTSCDALDERETSERARESALSCRHGLVRVYYLSGENGKKQQTHSDSTRTIVDTLLQLLRRRDVTRRSDPRSTPQATAHLSSHPHPPRPSVVSATHANASLSRAHRHRRRRRRASSARCLHSAAEAGCRIRRRALPPPAGPPPIDAALCDCTRAPAASAASEHAAKAAAEHLAKAESASDTEPRISSDACRNASFASASTCANLRSWELRM